jgi:hypothetical protein
MLTLGLRERCMRSESLRHLVTMLTLAVAVACGPREALKVTTIQVGRSLNSDNSVGAHTTSFKRNETIYASAINDAAGRGTVSVRWVYAGHTVREEMKDVSYTREAATEFHLQSPSAGFPPGEYRVEFQVNGQPVGARDFRVEG